ncbi:MAG: site-2 protease family protein, partial [Firmicutes bacterium]|nr:site-2 protease family protein [Bacillota bacterium]
MTILFVLLAILLLGILITVHELGHYMAARAQKIAVKEFSVGFGPTLWQRRSQKTDTLYSLRAIPLGGYCAFYDEDTETLSPDDPRRYTAAAAWKRMIVVVAGAAMNILLAFVLAVVLNLAYSAVPAQPSIAEVTQGSPAAQAGMLPGDLLLEVDVQTVTPGDVNTLTDVINASDDCKGVTVTLLRGGEEHTLSVIAQMDEAEGRRLIGV